MLRADGRAPHTPRSPCLELSALHAADGSALFTAEQSRVCASAVGPRAVPSRREHAARATLEVSWHSANEAAGTPAERVSLAASVRGALEAVFLAGLHPRTGTSVTVQVASDDGASLAAALNAACAACVDAGVALSHMIAAACVAVTADGLLLLDPTACEESEARCVCTFAFKLLPCAGQQASEESVVLSAVRGCCTVEEYVAALNAASLHAHKGVAHALRDAVRARHGGGEEAERTHEVA